MQRKSSSSVETKTQEHSAATFAERTGLQAAGRAFTASECLATTVAYYQCLWHFSRGGRLRDCRFFCEPKLGNEARHAAQLHLFSLCLVFRLWDRPHYRCGSFGEDLRVNLRNVALPGTGVPLAFVCISKWTFMFFLLFLYPLVCFVAAFAVWAVEQQQEADGTSTGGTGGEARTSPPRTTSSSSGRNYRGDGKSGKTWKAVWEKAQICLREVCILYQGNLVTPDTWFTWWRLNCALATYHSCLTLSDEYLMENKWDFLQKCHAKQVPITPCVGLGYHLVQQQESGKPAVPVALDTLVCKDKNEEGGMGIHFFKNAATGGNWILQAKLQNASCLQCLLPEPCPLSTFRVLTASEASMTSAEQPQDHGAGSSSPKVHILTCVFRAGRQHAKTDHRSIFYNVNLSPEHGKKGRITRGAINSHWYQLGGTVFQTASGKEGCFTKAGVFRRGFASKAAGVSVHPDSGLRMVGLEVPEIDSVLAVCERAHRELCPHVPLVGWDVALVDEDVGENHTATKPVLLEANLSCNFFLGDFDRTLYLDYMRRNFMYLEERENAAGARLLEKEDKERKTLQGKEGKKHA